MPWKPVKWHKKEVSLESIAVDEDVPIHFLASYPQITSSGMYVWAPSSRMGLEDGVGGVMGGCWKFESGT
jgi:hypothetical protein